MAQSNTALTIGLEEELFLVDGATGLLCDSWPKQFGTDCTSRYPDQIEHEFLACQVELITQPHETIASLAQEFYRLRAHLINTSENYGLAVLATSTHPLASWCEQHRSKSERYSQIENAVQMPAKRMLVGGMHFHVGIEDVELRLKLMSYLIRFLPVFLSLTTSSPFWRGVNSGLNSSRLSVINSLPRSGIPPEFSSYQEYQLFIDKLIHSGAIDSSKEIWWDIRLNAKYPTVEVRIADTCTRMEDALAVCALFQCIASHYLKHGDDPDLLEEDKLMQDENRWRAQRYPLSSLQLFTADEQTQSCRALLARIVNKLQPEAVALGCCDYLDRVKDVLHKGTSADEQRIIYQRSLDAGVSQQDALKHVIFHLIGVAHEQVRLQKN